MACRHKNFIYVGTWVWCSTCGAVRGYYDKEWMIPKNSKMPKKVESWE